MRHQFNEFCQKSATPTSDRISLAWKMRDEISDWHCGDSFAYREKCIANVIVLGFSLLKGSKLRYIVQGSGRPEDYLKPEDIPPAFKISAYIDALCDIIIDSNNTYISVEKAVNKIICLAYRNAVNSGDRSLESINRAVQSIIDSL